MKPRNGLVLLAALAFSLPAVLLAQSSSDPGAGTWVLNVAKSTYKPGPAPQSETRTYENTADGIHLTVHMVRSDGTAVTETSTYKLDGKSYAFTGSPDIDAIKVTRVNDHESRGTNMRGGKVVGHLTRVTSKDGKTLRITVTRQTASGQTEREVRVYDRQ